DKPAWWQEMQCVMFHKWTGSLTVRRPTLRTREQAPFPITKIHRHSTTLNGCVTYSRSTTAKRLGMSCCDSRCHVGKHSIPKCPALMAAHQNSHTSAWTTHGRWSITGWDSTASWNCLGENLFST